jgi:hypothetical protein
VRLYVLICGLPKVVTNDWEVARRETNNLHARLGGDRRAAYAATTAYAWFCMRNNHNRVTVQEYQGVQERVEAHLRDPAARFDVPADDIICQYARSAREQLGNPLWARL